MRTRTYLLALLIFNLLTPAAFADHQEIAPFELGRVYDIIAWRHADELKLSFADEEQFKATLTQHMKKRHKLLQKKSQLLKWISEYHHVDKLNETKAKEKIHEYETLQKQLHENWESEYQSLKDILSYKELLRFYAHRRELTQMLLKF